MVSLPDGEKNPKISLFVLAQLRNVTDRQTDRRTDGHRVTAIAALCIASHGKNVFYSLAGVRDVDWCYGSVHESLISVTILRLQTVLNDGTNHGPEHRPIRLESSLPRFRLYLASKRLQSPVSGQTRAP